MLFRKNHSFLKYLYPSLIWNILTSRKQIYLTFDDGPTPGVTDKVLEILKEFRAKATFFCLGRNVEKNINLYKQIIEDGHTVGNHTYSHLKGWYSRNKTYFDDIQLASNFVKSKLFRPPYGMIKRSQLKKLRKKYKIVMWDVMSYDFDIRLSREECLQQVMKNSKKGSIVVFHDSSKCQDKLFFVLPKFLEQLSSEGYHFDAIDDCNAQES
jgi:peptidoglycan/xylan/chitin deacetylase (PgdA/CDA1 family)